MTALIKAEKKDINSEHELSIIEQVVMQGDLSKLNAEQRVVYYHKVCDSLGLNPYTRPFDYISLNGKLTLYAKKDATEQLRQVKNISIVELEGKLVDDLYIVTAKASTPTGRTDQATGAVTIGNLRGEQKANAIMKAETKAKRRVTLSISGLGFTDESEIEFIPNASQVNVCLSTGEIQEPTISIQQAIELQTILASCSENTKKGFNNALVNTYKVSCIEELPLSKYDSVKNKLTLSSKEYQKECQKELLEIEMSNRVDNV